MTCCRCTESARTGYGSGMPITRSVTFLFFASGTLTVYPRPPLRAMECEPAAGLVNQHQRAIEYVDK